VRDDSTNGLSETTNELFAKWDDLYQSSLTIGDHVRETRFESVEYDRRKVDASTIIQSNTERMGSNMRDVRMDRLGSIMNDLGMDRVGSNVRDVGMDRKGSTVRNVDMDRVSSTVRDVGIDRVSSNERDVGIDVVDSTVKDVGMNNIVRDVGKDRVGSNVRDVGMDRVSSTVGDNGMDRVGSNVRDVGMDRVGSIVRDVGMDRVGSNVRDGGMNRVSSNVRDVGMDRVGSNVRDVSMDRKGNTVRDAGMNRMSSTVRVVGMDKFDGSNVRDVGMDRKGSTVRDVGTDRFSSNVRDVGMDKVSSNVRVAGMNRVSSTVRVVGMDRVGSNVRDVGMDRKGSTVRDIRMDRFSSNVRDVGMDRAGSTVRDVGMDRVSSTIRDVVMDRVGSNVRDVGMDRVGSTVRDVGMDRVSSTVRDVGTDRVGSNVRDVGMDRMSSTVRDDGMYTVGSDVRDVSIDGVGSNVRDVGMDRVDSTVMDRDFSVDALLSHNHSTDNLTSDAHLSEDSYNGHRSKADQRSDVSATFALMYELYDGDTIVDSTSSSNTSGAPQYYSSLDKAAFLNTSENISRQSYDEIVRADEILNELEKLSLAWQEKQSAYSIKSYYSNPPPIQNNQGRLTTSPKYEGSIHSLPGSISSEASNASSVLSLSRKNMTVTIAEATTSNSSVAQKPIDNNSITAGLRFYVPSSISSETNPSSNSLPADVKGSDIIAENPMNGFPADAYYYIPSSIDGSDSYPSTITSAKEQSLDIPTDPGKRPVVTTKSTTAYYSIPDSISSENSLSSAASQYGIFITAADNLKHHPPMTRGMSSIENQIASGRQDIHQQARVGSGRLIVHKEIVPASLQIPFDIDSNSDSISALDFNYNISYADGVTKGHNDDEIEDIGSIDELLNMPGKRETSLNLIQSEIASMRKRLLETVAIPSTMTSGLTRHNTVVSATSTQHNTQLAAIYELDLNSLSTGSMSESDLTEYAMLSTYTLSANSKASRSNASGRLRNNESFTRLPSGRLAFDDTLSNDALSEQSINSVPDRH